MTTDQSLIERVVYSVHMNDQGRGHRPTFREDRESYAAAVAGGFLTPVRRSWGHRVTPKGREVLKALADKKEAVRAGLRAAGIDPDKPACELTEEEVVAYIAHMRSKKKAD